MLTSAGLTRVPLRLTFLDGVRAVAAWFVVVHHMWIESFIGFPRNTGPWLVGWARWGHLAVAVFIVLSGFSLVLGPSRHGDRTVGGNADFLRRRAWRIVPPYWVALVISLLVIVVYSSSRSGDVASFKSLVVYGLLLQDVVGSATPNGAFWSIAVEFHIYFLFPLMLFVIRRFGQAQLVIVSTVGVVTMYVLGTEAGGLFEKFLHLTPQFILLFVFGLVAGRILVLREHTDRERSVASTVAIAAVVVTTAALGFVSPGYLVDQFFWVDLVFGVVVALVIYALGVGGLPRTGRVLSTRFLVFVGAFSYSVYLIHYPVMIVVKYGVAIPLGSTDLQRFLLLAAIGIPLIAACSYGFHLAFERPVVARLKR